MVAGIRFLIANVVCFVFQCQVGEVEVLGLGIENSDGDVEVIEIGDPDKPLVQISSGTVLGKKIILSGNRSIVSFKGIPYAESPSGNLRFRDPVPRRPWKGIWDATGPTPMCLQIHPFKAGILGTEDCLRLDIHTPSISTNKRFPVVVWIPGGANIFGGSSTYGPKYFLREDDIILVVPNFRLGVYGFLSTGDAASPGNWALKDILLAIKWVRENIFLFGGDPERIIVGGLSSGAHDAQAILFANSDVKKYIKGIIALSGSVLANNGLEASGRVQRASDLVATTSGCPTAAEGKSFQMVECLRKISPKILAVTQNVYLLAQPFMSLMLSLTIEPNVPGAVLTELPETLYEKGLVPKIPLIMTRSTNETSILLLRNRFPVLLLNSMFWNDFMTRFLKVGFRCCKDLKVSKEEAIRSLNKITKFYFNKSTPPIASKDEDFYTLMKLTDDTLFSAPIWKMIEYHHQIAPTYSYIMRHNTFTHLNPIIKAAEKIIFRNFTASHAVEFILLFNHKVIPPLEPGSDFEIASRNLINFFANFAKYGKPLYRNNEGELLPLWKPIEDLSNPLVLDVGLVNNITMIRDPLAGSPRLKIWDTVKF